MTSFFPLLILLRRRRNVTGALFAKKLQACWRVAVVKEGFSVTTNAMQLRTAGELKGRTRHLAYSVL
jgi:hypothetical protein